MPQGKIIPYSPGEYPELDGLKEGATVDFEGKARIVSTGGTEEGGDGEGGGSMGLEIVSIDLSPSDNEATTELNRMTGNDQGGAAARKLPPSGSGF